MEFIKTVGELRNLLKELNDDCKIELTVLVKDETCLLKSYQRNIKLQTDYDYCYSENSILLICENDTEEGGGI